MDARPHGWARKPAAGCASLHPRESGERDESVDTPTGHGQCERITWTRSVAYFGV